MKPVKSFCGYWNQTQKEVCFKWDVSGLGNDRYIYIIGLREENGRLRTDMSRFKLFDIRDMRNEELSGTSISMDSIKVGVFKMMFCAYSTDHAVNLREDEIIKACLEDDRYITTVMMGYARVTYVMQESVVDNAKLVKIYLKSDSDISPGVLGYRYTLDKGYSVVNAFPGAISKGKTEYPAVLVPKNCVPVVSCVENQFSGNVYIEAKKSKLFF